MPPKAGFPGTRLSTLQEQDGSAGNPDSEEIYESIDESLFDEYESSYIYNVESVPERPANTCKLIISFDPRSYFQFFNVARFFLKNSWACMVSRELGTMLYIV